MATKKRAVNGDEKLKEEWDSEDDLPSAELDLSSSDEEAESLSGSDGEEAPEADEQEIEDAVLDYMQAVAKKQRPPRGGAGGASTGSGDEEEEEDVSEDDEPASDEDASSEEEDDDERSQQDDDTDSSEDERPNRNTIGEVPIEWYNEEEHIGYDQDGQKIIKKGRRDALERHLNKSDNSKAWRTVYDPYNDEEITLSKEEVKMIKRIREGRFPHAEVNPFEPENDWFTRDVEIMPLSAAPEPKRRFTPSKWEEKKIVKLVRAMRKGWIKRTDDKPKEPEVYLMWDDDGKTVDKTASGLTYIPAPKIKLPGHEESYNPPQEYLPSEEEKAAYDLLDDEDKPQFVPQAFSAMRLVPAYSNFIKERFERCLDLYLCPRTRIKRINVDDPQQLLPKLPKPKDLQPFPTILSLRYLGHKGPVRSIAPHHSGQWLLSASADGTAKLWEVRTGRCMHTWQLGDAATTISWCPDSRIHLAAVSVGKRVLLLPTTKVTAGEAAAAATEAALATALSAAEEQPLTTWARLEDGSGGIEIIHNFVVKYVSWHARGDYFCSVSPTGNTQAVLVHQLSKGATQNPFRKNKGRVVRAIFHPTKPFFFVATNNHVRVYNLAKQALAKKLVTGSGVISSIAIHPSGDHVIIGSEDKRVAWYDMDLSTKPYKVLRYHDQPVRGVSFHKSYPLFASGADDGSAHVFHGMVYNDLMTNPLIVPVKILRGHAVADHQGVLDVAFHPTQPWLFTAGGDAEIHLFVNP